MQIVVTQAIHDALKGIKNAPDNLRVRIDAMTRADGGYALKLSDDDATAMAELVQWSMRTDPDTGKATTQSAPFEELIALIDAAQF